MSVERATAVRRVILVILILNVAVAVAKAVVGLIIGSLAVGSDAVHSLLDGASNVVGLVVLRAAAAPPDEDHPYGHQKIEIVAAALVGVVIAAGAVQFGWAAIQALVEGRAASRPGALGFGIVAATLIVNLFVAIYEARRGRELGSAFLVADASHTASDVFVTAGVLGSMIAVHFGIGWADAAGALVVLLVVARVAWNILSSNIGTLLDRAALSTDKIRELALSVPRVASVHRIRSRGTAGAYHIDMHVLVDGDLTLHEAHAITHEVEEKLRAGIEGVVDVTIHVEPEGEPEEAL